MTAHDTSKRKFLCWLRQTRREWRLIGNGRLRIPGRHAWMTCPICEVASMKLGREFLNGYTAGHKIGLPIGLRTSIMNAADGCPGHDTKLRVSLLRACGLQ